MTQNGLGFAQFSFHGFTRQLVFRMPLLTVLISISSVYLRLIDC